MEGDAVSNESRPGFFKDESGQWQKDRRKAVDRRGSRQQTIDDERRQKYRRKTDQGFIEREHREMMKEALDEFKDGQEGA